MAADVTKSAVHIVEDFILGAKSIDTTNTQVKCKGVYAHTITFDSASLATSVSNAADKTVTGVAVGDIVVVQPPSTWNAGLVLTAVVTAADTVSFRTHNVTAGTLDAASATVSYLIFDLT